jgi:phage anti-repressor protein
MKQKALGDGKTRLIVTAGEIHRMVGIYTKRNHYMRLCCKVMRESMQKQNGDYIVSEPRQGYGASLKISYNLKSDNSDHVMFQ